MRSIWIVEPGDQLPRLVTAHPLWWRLIMIGEHDQIVVLRDPTELPLCAGDIDNVVHVYREAGAFEVELVPLNGKMIGTATLSSGQVRAVLDGEIAHARLVAA